MAHYRLNPSVMSTAIRTGILDLHGRSLHEVPQDVFDREIAGALNILILSENKIMELPRDIALLQNIKELYLDNNALQTLPFELLHLPLLKGISLENNPRLNPELMQVFNKSPNVFKTRAKDAGPVLAWLRNQMEGGGGGGGRPSGSPLQSAGRQQMYEQQMQQQRVDSRGAQRQDDGYGGIQSNGEQDDYMYAELRSRAAQAVNGNQQQGAQQQGGYQSMPSPKSSHGGPRSFGDQQNQERQAMQARVAAAQLRGSGPDAGQGHGQGHMLQSNVNDASAARAKAHNQSSNIFSTAPMGHNEMGPRGRRSGQATPVGPMQSPFGTDTQYDTLKGRGGAADLGDRSNMPSPFAVQGNQIMNSQPRGTRSGQASPAPYGIVPSNNPYLTSSASAHLQVQSALMARQANSGSVTPNGGPRSGYATPHIRDQSYPPAPQQSNYEQGPGHHSRRGSGQYNSYGAHTPVDGGVTPGGSHSRAVGNKQNQSSIFAMDAAPPVQQGGRGTGGRVIQDTKLW